MVLNEIDTFVQFVMSFMQPADSVLYPVDGIP